MDELRRTDLLPPIVDLTEILENNGLHREKTDIEALLEYIGTMENKMDQMLKEMQGMREEVTKLSNRGIKARCTQLLSATENTLRNIRSGISTMAKNLSNSASKAIKAFRENGKDALIKAVYAMRIPSLLSHLKNGFNKASESMKKSANNFDVMRNELHEVGKHTENTFRAMVGKEPKKVEPLKSDNGVLAKMRDMYNGLSKSFTKMENGTDALISKLDKSKEKADERASVKSELKKLKKGKDKGTGRKPERDRTAK